MPKKTNETGEIYCSKCKKVCDILEYPEVKFDKPCKSWSAK